MSIFLKRTFFTVCISLFMVSCTLGPQKKRNVIVNDEPSTLYPNSYVDPTLNTVSEKKSTVSAKSYFVRPESSKEFSIPVAEDSDIWYIITNMSGDDINLADYYDFQQIDQSVYPNIKTSFSRVSSDGIKKKDTSFDSINLSWLSESDKSLILNKLNSKNSFLNTRDDSDNQDDDEQENQSPLGDYVGKKLKFYDISRLSKETLGSDFLSTVKLDATCKVVRKVGVGGGRFRTLVIYEEDNLNKDYAPTDNDYNIIADVFLKEESNNDLYDKLTTAFGNDYGYYNATFLEKEGQPNSYRSPADYLIQRDNNDDTITLLYCDIAKQGWKLSADGVTMGYYSTLNNLIPRPLNDVSSTFSNRRAMVTMHAYTSGRRYIGDGLSTLAHEFQHLIHDQYYNENLWQYGYNVGSESNSAFQEIFSAVAESYTARFINKATGRYVPGPFYVGYGGNKAGYLAENLSSDTPYYSGRGPDYLTSADSIAVDEWDKDSSTLGNYGIANAFAHYLLVNYGIEVFKAYIDTNKPSSGRNSELEKIVELINANAETFDLDNFEGKNFTEVTPATLIADWSTAMLLSKVPMLYKPYCMNKQGWFVVNGMEVPSVNIHLYCNYNTRGRGFSSTSPTGLKDGVLKSGASAFIKVKNIKLDKGEENYVATAPAFGDDIIFTCVALPTESAPEPTGEDEICPRDLSDYYPDDTKGIPSSGDGESKDHPDLSGKDNKDGAITEGFALLDTTAVNESALLDSQSDIVAKDKFFYDFGSEDDINITLPEDYDEYEIFYMFTNTKDSDVSVSVQDNIFSSQSNFSISSSKDAQLNAQNNGYLFHDVLYNNSLDASSTDSSLKVYQERSEYKSTKDENGKIVSPLGDYEGKKLMFYDKGKYEIKATCKLVRPVMTAFGERTLVIYVEDGMFSLFGNLPTDKHYALIADTFLKEGPDNDIYDKLTAIFGNEWGYYNASYLSKKPVSDSRVKSQLIYQDNTITLLYCNVSTEIPGTGARLRQGDGIISDLISGGVVTGYIDPDNMSRQQVKETSNERAMITLHAHLSGGEYFTDGLRTLAHEFQHLIHQQYFNQYLTRYSALKDKIPNEDRLNVSFDEIFSAAVENYIFDFINQQTGLNNPGPFQAPAKGDSYNLGYLSIDVIENNGITKGRGPYLINSFDKCNLEKWNESDGMSLYGMTNGFGNYLMINYGPKVFKEYYKGNKAYLDGMVAAINKVYTEANITKADLVANYGTALALSCIPKLKAPYSMNKEGWYNINGMRMPSVNIYQNSSSNGLNGLPYTDEESINVISNTNALRLKAQELAKGATFTDKAPELPEGVKLRVLVLPSDLINLTKKNR